MGKVVPCWCVGAVAAAVVAFAAVEADTVAATNVGGAVAG